jgi:universal stress protein A
MIDLKRILVPTDFSKFSENALRYATAFAEKFGSHLYLLHVVQDLTWFIPEAILVAPAAMPPLEEFRTAARTALDRVVKELNLPGIKIEAAVAEGTPFEAIIRFAREQNVDLIVMGTHGHTGLAHMLMGSVAEKVVRKAPCPVLSVRHPEHEFIHP